MTFEEFNMGLLNNSGVTGAIIKNQCLLKDPDKPSFTTLFFKPCVPTTDLFYKALEIVSAPIFLTILAIVEIVNVVMEIVFAFLDLIYWEHDNAIQSLTNALNSLYSSFIFAISAVFSPLLNAVDFLGSVVSTSVNDEDEGVYSPF